MLWIQRNLPLWLDLPLISWNINFGLFWGQQCGFSLDVKTPNGSAQGATQHQGFSASPRCFCRSLASTPFGQTWKRSCASLASGDVTTTVDTARITNDYNYLAISSIHHFLKAWAMKAANLDYRIWSSFILHPCPVLVQDSGRDPRLGADRGWRVEALDTGHPTKVGTATALAYVYKLGVYK